MRPYNLTVVVATYAGESAKNLRESLRSICEQTVAPTRLIVVKDGPIPSDQREVLDEVVAAAPFQTDVIALSKNVGRGVARNAGISAAPDGLIALMDSDDICKLHRFEKQLQFLEQHPNVDLVAGWTEEFFEDLEGESPIIKYCPLEHAQIASSLRWTNCVANPTVMMKKSAWQKTGGFSDFRDINEDYLFYLRLITSGAVFACLPDVLLSVRINSQQRLRRRGLGIIRADLRFRYTAWRERHIPLVTTCIATSLIVARRLMPASADMFLHKAWRKLSKILFSA